MLLRKACVLVALLTGTLADLDTSQRATGSRKCARTCKDTSKYKYVPGMTYEYEYNVQTQTSMVGASKDQASLGIQAAADIEVLSKCEMVLRLRDVKVSRSDTSPSNRMENADESGEFKRNLERSPLRFSFQDGVIQELCPAEGEATWALNIKRGLLTAVQNSMDSLDREQSIVEKDVTGECHTDYKVIQGWFSSTIKKTKDLLGCTDRTGYHSSVHGRPYRVPSEIQSLPLMKSIHECEQEFDTYGLLKSALIRETHIFRPFSRATSGATTKVLQKLTYKTQRSGVTTRQGEILNRAGITFEHSHGQRNKIQLMRDAESKLREICKTTHDGIHPDTPSLFSELVDIIKNLRFDDIKTIYEQLKSGSLCTDNSWRLKNIFLDSIPMASTSGSVRFLKDILLNRTVIGAQATMWITSLSLIPYPTLEMLREVKALLDTPQSSKAAMLPISSMVNNYCNHHEDCSVELAVTDIISTMEKTIGYGCYIRDSNLETSLVALRALGNAGHLDRMTPTLSSCFNRQANPMEVRVAAIQAYRRLPCTADRSKVMAIYQDYDGDPELRIEAYLAVKQCPSEDVFSRIQSTLEFEKAKQVGSFVWSHLTNLMETSSPQKQIIRRILEDKTLGRNFDLSALKYSRNYEGSVFLDKYNTGAMLESNVIFSDNSAIPRSAMLNLTVDLFGSSLNLFEVGGRVERVEYLIKKYLNQNAFFRDWLPTNDMLTDNITDLKGDIYMKILGKEMYYDHFSGVDPIDSIKNVNFLDFLAKMFKKQDYSFTQSMMILDSSMIIPTSSGLPLSLTVNGTATIDIQAYGQVDLQNVLTSPSSLLIAGIVKPSGSMKITGTMTVDAFVTKTGLRVVNTWHSNTALKGRIELSRGKILNADIDFPQQKMEILDVSTEFISIHGDQEKKQELATGNKKSLELCTGARLAKITGLELCNEFQWPSTSMVDDAPYFPFTGPFTQHLVLHKRDTHAGYKFFAKRTGNKQNTFVHFILNTPQSRTDRTIDVTASVKRKTKEFEVEALTPWKKASLKGSVTSEKKKVGLKGQLTVDKSSEYIFISEVGINRKKSAVTYTPRLEIRRPRGKVIQLTGTVETKVNQKASVELTLKGVTTHPVNMKSCLVNSKIEKSIKGTFSLVPEQNYVLEAGYVYRETGKKNLMIKAIPTLTVKTPKRELVSLKGAWVYKESESLQGNTTVDVHNLLSKPITVQCDVQQKSGKRTKRSAKVIIKSEFLDAKVTGNVESTKKTVNPTIILEYTLPKAKTSWSNKHTIRTKLTDHDTKTHLNSKFHMYYTNQEHPHLNLFLKGDFSHSTRHTNVDVTIKYGVKVGNRARQVTGSASIDHHVNKRAVNIKYTLKTEIEPMDVSLDIKGKYRGNARTVGSDLTANYRKHTTSTSFVCDFLTNAKETTALVEIKTPHQQLKYLNAEVSLDHETKVASSFGSFSTGPNGNNMSYTIEFTMSSNTSNRLALSADGVFSSPSNSDRKFTWRLYHVGGLFNFNTTGRVLYDETKPIEGSISFLFNGLAHVNFEADMTTPFEGLENKTVKYQHLFSKTETVFIAEVTNGFSERAIFRFSFVNSTNVQLEMSLKTLSRNNAMSFAYTCPLDNCEGKTEVQMFGYSTLVQIVYKRRQKVSVLVSSSSTSLDLLKVFLNYELTSTMLNASVLYTFKSSTYECVAIGVKERDRTEIVLKLRTPFQDFRETGLWYQQYKVWKHFYVALRYRDTKEVAFSVSNNVTHEKSRYIPTSVLSLIELKTPFRNWEILSFRFDGLLKCGQCHLNTTFTYANHEKIIIDSIWIEKDPCERWTITFFIKTPFEKYRASTVVFSGLKKDSYFNGTLDIRIDEMVVTLYSTMKKDYKEGNITMHTNFQGYELMEGTFIITNTYRLYNATSTFNVNNETVRTEFVRDRRQEYHSHLTIWTPVDNFTSIGFTYDRRRHDDVSGYELNIRYRDNKTITVRSTFYPPVNGTRTMKTEMITPITGYEKQHILFIDRSKRRKTFNETIRFFSSKGEQLTLTFDCVLYSFVDMNLYFKSKETESTDLLKLSFRSPSVNNVTVKGESKLSLGSFGNYVFDYYHFIDDVSVEGTLRVDRNWTKYIGTNVYSTFSENNFHGSVNIDLDIANFRNITVVVSKEGALTDMNAKGLISFDESAYEVSLKHVQIPGELRKVDGAMILNWDRNNHDSNLQIQAQLVDRSRQLLNKGLTLKFIHPTRTVGIIGNVLISHLQARSRGEFIWTEDEERSFFYDVGVEDRSRRYSKAYDGTFKVGSHLRNLQMDGSYSQTDASKTLDGAFSWDADRDDTKKIGMKAVFTPGDKNKQADLSLRLPSIGKDIKVETGLLLNDGRSVFNGKTQLSYSKDDRKTVTVTSSVDDISSGYGKNKYRFVIGVSHPYTDVDVKLVSYIGSSSEQVSAGLEMTYLTAGRQRLNFNLGGQINTAMQMFKLKMQCPIKDLEATADVGEKPFKLVVNNMTMTTVLTPWKALEFATDFDIDNPGKMLHMNARYINSSAMQAEIYHQKNSRAVFDSLFALRLNTSRLLHTRIYWRPKMITDVQVYLTRNVETYSQNAKATFYTVYESVGEELAGKYHQIAQATKEEISFYLNLFVSEAAIIERQLGFIRADIRNMYRRNDFYLANIGDYSETAERLYKDFLKPLLRRSVRWSKSMTEHLQNANDLNMKEVYDGLLYDWVFSAKEKLESIVEDVLDMISRSDDMIEKMWDAYQHHYNIVQTKATATVDTIMDLPNIVDSNFEISNSISPYTDRLAGAAIGTYGSFKDMLMNSGNMISSYLIDAEQRRELQMLFTDNIYTDSVTSLEQHLQKVPELVKQGVMNYTRDALTMYAPKTTVWDPEHGEIQMELSLPIPLKSLDKIPDVKPYVRKAKTTVNEYIPAKNTLKRLYKKWRSNRTKRA